MVSLDKLQVIETEQSYLVEVGITFQNKNPDAVKLRNGSFRATVETRTNAGSKIDIGNASMDELEIPKAANRSTAGTVAKTVTIVLGPKDQESVTKMVKLWNVLGNPAASMTLVLKAPRSRRQAAQRLGLRARQELRGGTPVRSDRAASVLFN